MNSRDGLSKRLATFTGWKSELKCEKLAKAGFHHTSRGDKVKCEFCGLQLDNWDKNDDPFEEHRSRRPNCPFVINNVERTRPYLQGVAENSDRWRECVPKSTVKMRLETFVNYPESLVPKLKDLVQAGFFYNGTADQVICFQCGVGLNNWEPEDDPWLEHKKWSPGCPFLMKGDVRKFLEMKQTQEQLSISEEKEPFCVVCKSRTRNILSLPCRHLATCKECNDKLYSCPICQQEEERRIQVYKT